MKPLCMRQNLTSNLKQLRKWQAFRRQSKYFNTPFRSEPAQTPEKPKLDPNAPKGSVRIRLSNGKSIGVEFNLNAKVAEIYAYVAEYLISNLIRISPLKENFILSAGGKPLANKEATFEEEKLSNSMIIQRNI